MPYMWADTLMSAERAHLFQLLAWAAASVLAGTALLAWMRTGNRRSALVEQFGAQALAWGGVELAWAAWRLHSLAPRDVSAATRMDRLLWLNLGLDLGFILTGLAIALCGWTLGRRRGVMGAGVGVVVQGVALSVLNLLLASVISRVEDPVAEVTLDLLDLPRAEAWAQIDAHIRAVLAGVDDDIAAMATMSSLIHNALEFLWTGFYRVVEAGRLLRVGPYQGTMGCLEIQVGRGVCGTAAAERRSVVVADVNSFPGHISCDARSRSEIVVPVFNSARELIAVLDIDSAAPAAFGEEDREGLERVVAWFAGSRA